MLVGRRHFRRTVQTFALSEELVAVCFVEATRVFSLDAFFTPESVALYVYEVAGHEATVLGLTNDVLVMTNRETNSMEAHYFRDPEQFRRVVPRCDHFALNEQTLAYPLHGSSTVVVRNVGTWEELARVALPFDEFWFGLSPGMLNVVDWSDGAVYDVRLAGAGAGAQPLELRQWTDRGVEETFVDEKGYRVVLRRRADDLDPYDVAVYKPGAANARAGIIMEFQTHVRARLRNGMVVYWDHAPQNLVGGFLKLVDVAAHGPDRPPRVLLSNEIRRAEKVETSSRWFVALERTDLFVYKFPGPGDLVLEMMRARTGALAAFVKADGDHAAVARVLSFLLDPY